jgi:hypothetical protein
MSVLSAPHDEILLSYSTYNICHIVKTSSRIYSIRILFSGFVKLVRMKSSYDAFVLSTFLLPLNKML